MVDIGRVLATHQIVTGIGLLGLPNGAVSPEHVLRPHEGVGEVDVLDVDVREGSGLGCSRLEEGVVEGSEEGIVELEEDEDKYRRTRRRSEPGRLADSPGPISLMISVCGRLLIIGRGNGP